MVGAARADLVQYLKEEIAESAPFLLGVPHGIKTGYNPRLGLLVASFDRGETVMDLARLQGLSVVTGEGQYTGRPLLEFVYFSPKTNAREQRPRRVAVKEIWFGTMEPGHAGERPDFYFVGEDTQYTNLLKEQRVRNFPFWRTGAEGSPEDIRDYFLRPQRQMPQFLVAN